MRVACWRRRCHSVVVKQEGREGQAKKQANPHKLNKRWDLERETSETIVYEVIH